MPRPDGLPYATLRPALDRKGGADHNRRNWNSKSGPPQGGGQRSTAIRTFTVRHFLQLRQTYWFWPSVMTALAFVLGFALPYVDMLLGSDWTRSVPFLRATQVEGARAILTTLAGATLGVAGVAFSITIVAVSFASSNYGPRLIGNFMADRTNQVVLGVFVATFVYCLTVLSTVHADVDTKDATLAAFVPQVSVLFAIGLTLASVGALIGYIHHIPESINIMKLVASIGEQLREAVVRVRDEAHAGGRMDDVVDLAAWQGEAERDTKGHRLRASAAGHLQWIDVKMLDDIGLEHDLRFRVDRAAGDFLVVGEPVLTVLGTFDPPEDLSKALHRCYALGPIRTAAQDMLFLADQLVEVAVRALSPSINDPRTAILCLNWLAAVLDAFARREPTPGPPGDARVLYSRVAFETMLNRAFDELRQHVCTDRTVVLHALDILADTAIAACRPAMADACATQIERYGRSAAEQLTETLAREEVAKAVTRALDRVGRRGTMEVGEASARKD